jgi:hypothetical protein
MLHVEYLLKKKWLCANPQKAGKIMASLEQRLREAQCASDGKPVPVSLMPLLLSSSDLALLQYSSEIIARCIQKTIDASLASPRVRQCFAYEELPKEWLASDPGYKTHCVTVRLDALFDGKHVKYLEFTTDHPAGQALADSVRAVVAAHPFYKNLVMFPQDEQKPTVLEAAFQATKEIYQEFRQGKATTPPRVVFLDYRESGRSQEVQAGVDFFNQRGIKAILADPRDFQFKDGVAYVGDQRVDVVRRHMKASKLLSCQSEIQPFIDGYLNRAFCMINSFRSVYGSEKSLLAIMSNPDFHHLYSPEEVRAIKRHIPWTRRLADINTDGPDGSKIELGKFLRENREKTVLKASYGTQDVSIGMATPIADWDKMVSQYLGNKDWVAQEYVPVPTLCLPVIQGKKVSMQSKYFNVNPFVITGRYAGLLGRFSDSPVVNIGAGGGILPLIRY